ncbi:MAG TPA: hypothetical protein VN428_12630 [Bryobacteraceae bacterium]|nr:hypothetical protein [Bryobacteraceae bacterium]
MQALAQQQRNPQALRRGVLLTRELTVSSLEWLSSASENPDVCWWDPKRLVVAAAC